jgi:hypothetical protein
MNAKMCPFEFTAAAFTGPNGIPSGIANGYFTVKPRLFGCCSCVMVLRPMLQSHIGAPKQTSPPPSRVSA